MSFLDTTTTVKEGNMTTDLYSKPTDKHQYLSPCSCHPKHCFKTVPFIFFPMMTDNACNFLLRGMVSENKWNPFVDLFLFVLQEVISVNCTDLWKPTLYNLTKTKMSFLDTTTTVKEGNITTDLYSKPTDKHQYLSPSSCHPKHCFKSILILVPIAVPFIWR
jgi:hypothetical protein